MTTTISAAILIGFFVTALLMFLLRPVAFKFGFLDRPGGRKHHVGQVPLIGGGALFIGISAAVFVFQPSDADSMAYLVASGLIVLVGLIDDGLHLSPFLRLAAQFVAAVILVIGVDITIWHVSGQDLLLDGLVVFASILVIMATTNAFNLLDGIDGLSAGTALVAITALLFLFNMNGVLSLNLFPWIVVAAISAFLLFNVPFEFTRPIKAFLGDSGSTLLGITVVFVGLLPKNGVPKYEAVVVLMWCLAYPLTDLGHSVIRRLLQHRSPLYSDRGHYHYLLLNAGLSQPLALSLLVGLNILLSVTGLTLARLHVPLVTVAALYILAVLILMMSFDYLRIRLSRINGDVSVSVSSDKT